MSADRTAWLGDGASAWRRALATGVAGALTAGICFAVFAIPFDLSAGDALALAGIAVFLIALPVLIGGRRGLLVTWVLLAALWIFVLYNNLMFEEWRVSETVRALPSPFVAWSWWALPVAVATVLLVGGSVKGALRIQDLPLLSAWIGLMIASARLAFYALDVSGTPRLYPPTTITVGVVLTPAPLFLAWWGVRALRSPVSNDPRAGA